MRKDFGVFYIAAEYYLYVFEILDSVESLFSSCGEVPVTVFTDLPQANSILQHAHPSINVKEIPKLTTSKDSWANGMLAKVHAISTMPFSKCVYIDSDTRILSSNFLEIFEQLEHFDIGAALATPNNSLDAKLVENTIFAMGVLAFRRNDRVKDFFQKWLDMHFFFMKCQENLSLSAQIPGLSHIQDEKTRRRALVSDQISFAQLCLPGTSPDGLRIETLGDEWNFRHPKLDPKLDVIVHHQNGFKVDAEEAQRRLRELVYTSTSS